MASVNKVILIGHLGRDPEVRSFQNGGKIVSLRIATSESWTNKQSGEKKDRTEWHSISITNEELAKVAEQYLRKGSKVYIEGQLETRKWQDQSGADRYSTEVVLRPYRGEIVLLDAKGEGQRNEPREQSTRQEQANGYDAGGRPNRDLDDEIPFACEWR